MRAVLMAAGMGTRLSKASGGIAKALAKVHGKTLLEHQVSTLKAAGFAEEQLVIVGGFQFDELAPVARRIAPSATLLQNERFRHQNLLSLLTARTELQDGFLLVNVDHLMPPAIHRMMLDFPSPVVACVESGRPLQADEMKVKLTDNGQLENISKQLTDFDIGYIGMTKCESSAVSSYLAAADAVLRDIGPEKAVVEMILGKLAANGAHPAVCDCAGFRWAEVDTPEDLRIAEALLDELPTFFEQSHSLTADN